MRRELLVLCGALAMAGCGGGKDDCTAGCEKAIECGEEGSLEQCVSQCLADPGNQARAKCYAGISGCDKAAAAPCSEIETTCTRAVKKINECMAANGGTTPLKYAGWCSDQAKVTASGGTKAVPFRTWSTTYLACTIDPKTCHCPGQTWYTDL